MEVYSGLSQYLELRQYLDLELRQYLELEFCGGKFSDRVSSEKLLAVSAAGPPAAFFPEIDISGFFGHAHFGKV